MQTQKFAEDLFWVMALPDQQRIALMRAEAVPWRCHRWRPSCGPSMIAKRYFSSNPASFLATGTFLRVW
jgi:hypothetical protein